MKRKLHCPENYWSDNRCFSVSLQGKMVYVIVLAGTMMQQNLEISSTYVFGKSTDVRV